MPITNAKFQELSASATYRNVRQFKNHSFAVYVTWFGVLPDEMYRLVVTNLGKVIETSFYASEQQAIDNYEHFLAVNCGCEWVPSSMDPGTMMLLEVGNMLTAGKATQEHVKSAEFARAIETNPEFGSW